MIYASTVKLKDYGIEDFQTKNVGGKIKVRADDFIVEEIRPTGEVCTVSSSFSEKVKDISPKRRKKYLHCTLVKRNLTTNQAISKIANDLRISRKRFSFAGMKDKRAITAQRISIRNVGVKNLKMTKHNDLTLKNVTYSKEKILLGDLYGNRFTITIRDPKHPEDFEKAVATLKRDIKNYFGLQRFGTSRPTNHRMGKQLLLGNFEKAAKIFLTHPGDRYTKERRFAAEHWGHWKDILGQWPKALGVEAALLHYLVKHPTDFKNAFRELPKNLRRLFVHAYQSYIFNLALSKLNPPPEKLPLVGYMTKLQDPAEEIIKEILEEENITRRDFRCFKMPELASKGADRRTKIVPEEIEILAKEKELLRIRFTLWKGAYATLVLMKLGVTGR